MGFPSVCCEYHSNKEDVLGPLQHRVGQGGSSKQIEEEKVGRVRKKPCSHHRRQMLDKDRTLLVGHNHVAIHRLIEMG